jgi:hypothetical protein
MRASSKIPRWAYWALWVLLLVSCPGGRKLQSPIDAGSPSPGAGVAGEPPVERLVLTVRQELADGGMAILDFDAGHPPELEPTRHLGLSTNLPIHNYRIRVFDEADRAIASDDLAEDSASGLEYQIHFPESLKTGHRFALVIDAQTGDSVLDAHGHALADQRVEFQVLGPREKLPPKKKPAKRKRKRHSDNLQRAPPLLAVERLEDAEVGWARP